jgi:uncharacterized protein
MEANVMSATNITDGSVPEAVVCQLFEAVGRRDAASLLACYDPAIHIHEAPSLPYGGEYHGLEGAVRHAQGYLRTWDAHQSASERQLDPELICSGDRVAVLWRQKARSRRTGHAIDLPVLSLYRVGASGKVLEARMCHFDTVQLAAFLAQAG